LQRFLEIDRATLSVDRLAAELVRYAELYRLAGGDGEPLWRLRYPVFPPVHCVSIEQAPPGSALDDQLRREQAKAVFDLLIAHRRRTAKS
jgi:hypothetical protein